MKTLFFSLLVVLVFLSVSVPAVAAAPAQENKNVTLVGVQYQKAGIVLYFHTSGLSKSDLKNTFFFTHSNDHDMYCTFVDNTTDVHCTVPKKLAEYAGEGFHGTLADIGFWGVLPSAKDFPLVCPAGEVPWYSIAVYENGSLVFSLELPSWIWDMLVESGILDEAQNEGVTLENTGTFCAPDIEDEPV